jgi:aldose sugar dehydrogenase
VLYCCWGIYYYYYLPSVHAVSSVPEFSRPFIMNDPDLKIEVVAEGLDHPTAMAFLDDQDMLVLEKERGTVQRILNGTILSHPILDVDIANKEERGMLGLAIAKHDKDVPTYVFLYYTETEVKGSDICSGPNTCVPGHDPIGNRLYRYDYANDTLVDPKLLLDLPAIPVPTHNGGKIIVGPDENLYLIVGDLDYRTKTQNIPDEANSNGTSVIYRITQDGKAAEGRSIFGNIDPMNKFYAYGIRNSFGMDFDPLTGNLWDTENGPDYGDEINLVLPGFNSGWAIVQGVWTVENQTEATPKDYGSLLYLNGKPTYSSPEFSWLNTTAPTAIKFLNSDKLGKQYQDDIFVGDYHAGNLYHFDLNKDRTKLELHSPLADTVANTTNELSEIIFATGFDGISDLQVGPDGFLYILAINQGIIYRIVPTDSSCC